MIPSLPLRDVVQLILVFEMLYDEKTDTKPTPKPRQRAMTKPSILCQLFPMKFSRKMYV